MRYIDETGDTTPRRFRSINRMFRQRRAGLGWWNWYYNRGHITLEATASDLRRLSWRRAL